MTLMTRIGRLFRADLNAVLDGLEEPAAVLRQALADMEDSFARGTAEAARLAGEAALLAQAAEDAAGRAARAAEEAALCLDAGKDDLARTSLRRQLECELRARECRRHLERLDATRAALATRLAAQRERLAALNARAALVPDPAGEAPGDGLSDAPWSGAAHGAVSEAEVEVALLALRGRRAGA